MNSVKLVATVATTALLFLGNANAALAQPSTASAGRYEWRPAAHFGPHTPIDAPTRAWVAANATAVVQTPPRERQMPHPETAGKDRKAG